MKLALNLLGFKGFSCLEEIINNRFNELLEITVVIATDKSITNDYSKEIKNLCETKKITSYNRAEIHNYREYNYVFAIGWRWLIKGVVDSKLIIFHDSLLPKYRGFAPLVNAALNKEDKVGVTALFGAEEYDKGEIIAQRSLEVTYPIRVGELIGQITSCYIDLTISVLTDLAAGVELIGKKQNENDASYSVWLDSEDYFLDWREGDSDYIANKINLLGAPYQPAKSFMNGEIVKIHTAEVYSDLAIEQRHIGKVLIIEDGCPVVICANGLIKITNMSDENDKSLIPFKLFRVRFK
ncbi:formyltransferase family protein [Pseudoalteromonas sp. SWYJZ12]|uniref:formyltransferase family protein n=1 Tax=Pseudoalteromonas sp. SWYJZ12 TaxID=2792067 RepID=UPI0018CDB5EB|nr:formyltransferase family protein [Pseudoalteromonas sp. SWYJZ12]MBH0002705.1 hypothetical protein [Pseudoalteromonas sp. SWYJZ12]